MGCEHPSFAEKFRECCSQSCTNLAYERQKTEAEYAARAQRCDELYTQLQEKLGDERKLINNFDVAKNNLLAFDSAFIYQQGFRDCIYLLRWIGLLPSAK